MPNLTPEEMVIKYFRGVDGENIEMIFETLAEDCIFMVETHGVKLKGHAEIKQMFERLWSNHKWVRHDQFHFVNGRAGQDIAVRFQVTNKHHDDSLAYKSNCNFFSLNDGLFTEVRVYMTGQNTLDKKD